MYLFEEGTTTESFCLTLKRIKEEIEGLSNEKICSTDLDELSYYYIKNNMVEKIELSKSNIKKELCETKIKQYNSFYRNRIDRSEPEYYLVDGYKVVFTIPFEGNEELLRLEPPTHFMKKFPVDRILPPTEEKCGEIVISLEFRTNELQDVPNSHEFVSIKFNEKMRPYYETINRINEEVKKYNDRLSIVIREWLDKRLQKANEYLQMRERLELPLELSRDAPNTKPILMKKIKKKVSFPNQKKEETEYEISDADYENIKNVVGLACIAMEKTARTFAKLPEEDLRDIILANLNTHYQGTASGETFNKTGKTDIYIPFANKAAYIAECKVWHGNKKFLEAIDQLCGYTTWRDTKTSLIVFNKDNKNFEEVINKIDQALKQMERCKEIIRREHNEWQGKFTKEEGSEDSLVINIVVFDLYIATLS